MIAFCESGRPARRPRGCCVAAATVTVSVWAGWYKPQCLGRLVTVRWFLDCQRPDKARPAAPGPEISIPFKRNLSRAMKFKFKLQALWCQSLLALTLARALRPGVMFRKFNLKRDHCWSESFRSEFSRFRVFNLKRLRPTSSSLLCHRL